ncbi:MAG: DnaJ domain-containing protein [Intestinibacillus sp.]
MDPYKVLGVTPDTSNDDIKRAYRELARKYHPDNYVNNPLADLAEARMKEINEAYDQIMSQRTGRSSGNAQQQSYGGTYGDESTNPIYSQIRAAINAGNLAMAEEMLRRSPQHDAEWYFLMGSVYYRKGWFDEANRAYTQACQMDPANTEYRNALNMLNMSGGYGGYRPMATMGACDCCAQLMCLNCCCSCCGNGC